jgi:hypothetical protein
MQGQSPFSWDGDGNELNYVIIFREYFGHQPHGQLLRIILKLQWIIFKPKILSSYL